MEKHPTNMKQNKRNSIFIAPFEIHNSDSWAFLVVKNPPAMQETWVQSLCWADPLEEEMATHSSIPAWEIPWTEEPGGLQYMGSQRAEHDWD